MIANVGTSARRIVKCNKDTLNTPYKAGLTAGIDTGTAIISMGSVNYGVILYLPDGGVSIAPYICKKTNGTWGEWTRLTTNADLKVKYGFATVAAKQNETVSFNITFDEAFKVLPAVVSTVTTTQPSENHTSINNVTVNGFTGFLYRAGASGNINVRWIAVGK